MLTKEDKVQIALGTKTLYHIFIQKRVNRGKPNSYPWWEVWKQVKFAGYSSDEAMYKVLYEYDEAIKLETQDDVRCSCSDNEFRYCVIDPTELLAKIRKEKERAKDPSPLGNPFTWEHNYGV